MVRRIRQQPAGQRHQPDDGAAILSQSESDREAVELGGNNFDRDGLEIVGVVEDARYSDLKDESLNMVYLLAMQTDRYLENVEVRVAGNPTALANAVRNALRESEPRLAVGTGHP